MTVDSSIKKIYFDNQSSKVLDANLNHNHVTGLHNIGNSKAIAWLFCIMIWREMFQDQVGFHKKKARIFTWSKVKPMTFSKHKWTFSETKWSIKFPQQEGWTNNEDIWCMWHSSILDLGIDVQILISST